MEKYNDIYKHKEIIVKYNFLKVFEDDYIWVITIIPYNYFKYTIYLVKIHHKSQYHQSPFQTIMLTCNNLSP